MQELPHFYTVNASSEPAGAVAVTTEEGAALTCFPPSHFGGEKGTQSPEYLLSEAVASCFILSFRAIAKASKLEWTGLTCDATGTLDKKDRNLVFTEFTVTARLQVPGGVSEEKALRLLEKAEQSCLITNSLCCPVSLRASVETV